MPPNFRGSFPQVVTSRLSAVGLILPGLMGRRKDSESLTKVATAQQVFFKTMYLYNWLPQVSGVAHRRSHWAHNLVAAHRLSTQAWQFCSIRNLPRPRFEPVSPALAGGFLSTAPLGKSPGVSLTEESTPAVPLPQTCLFAPCVPTRNERWERQGGCPAFKG